MICIVSAAPCNAAGSVKREPASPTRTQNSFQAKCRISYLLPKGNTIYFLHFEEKKIYLFKTVPSKLLSLETFPRVARALLVRLPPVPHTRGRRFAGRVLGRTERPSEEQENGPRA